MSYNRTYKAVCLHGVDSEVDMSVLQIHLFIYLSPSKSVFFSFFCRIYIISISRNPGKVDFL